MAEITEAAYQQLRQYIIENWQFIELRDQTNIPIIRLSPDDERVTWVHQMIEGEQEIVDYDELFNPIYGEPKRLLPNTLQLQIVIKGNDPDITLPQTFAKSVIYNVPNNGEAISEETFEPFNMQNQNDQLTVIHNIQVPQL
ncbi:hypothetical protein KGF86_06975 [Ornithinibacillus massiliensis]|uniref:Uncharacterized protein n=1 Tax=Ornithinibacillus massiliensis TaxID=1944633 RepID=A0ABS5MCC0_9BACI|nr:hypothetical protein [Ornithinibacillus massiliensis]MBS3679950.1 hypothetical protein [Ornithinibacillus massiliensis]